MEQKLYFKHLLIASGDQDDVEREINVFNDERSKLINVTVTPELVGHFDAKFPKYVYHVCIVYTDRK